jgi:hypothetical protein
MMTISVWSWLAEQFSGLMMETDVEAANLQLERIEASAGETWWREFTAGRLSHIEKWPALGTIAPPATGTDRGTKQEIERWAYCWCAIVFSGNEYRTSESSFVTTPFEVRHDMGDGTALFEVDFSMWRELARNSKAFCVWLDSTPPKPPLRVSVDQFVRIIGRAPKTLKNAKVKYPLPDVDNAGTLLYVDAVNWLESVQVASDGEFFKDLIPPSENEARNRLSD